ncbi:hypothetical protein, partial [Aeromonas caviae]
RPISICFVGKKLFLIFNKMFTISPCLKVTLLNGAITTADNSALCYLQRVPMKGYVIKEMCMFDNEPSSAKAAHGQLFRNLRELVTLTGMMFH